MLKRMNRITTAHDFSATRRKSRRTGTSRLLVQVKASEGPTRFGFVVSTAVGNAVTRNKVKRRMREIADEIVRQTPEGVDVVVQAFAPAAQASYAELREDILRGVRRGTSPR